MSIAVYDTVENRVSAVWSKNEEGEVTYTEYVYDTSGLLIYTISGSTKSEVEDVINAFSGVNVNNLTAQNIETYLHAGMSIAIYDTSEKRVSSIWSKNESGEVSFTEYVYNEDDILIYTVSGSEKTEVVNAVSLLAGMDISTLSAADLESILSASMSIAIYDTAENRISSIWSKSEDGEITFTAYIYNEDENLIYTVSGSTRTEVDSVVAALLTVDVSTLTNADIDALLGDGMSIAIYDTDKIHAL